jgi:hypothetical protein
MYLCRVKQTVKTMKTRTKLIIAALILLLIIIGGTAYYINSLKQDLKEEQLAHRKEILRNDELKIINETQVRKLIADTLKQSELNKIVADLGIEIDKAKNAKPKIVYVVKATPKEVVKETDSLTIDSTGISIESYYPQKKDYFAKYENRITLKDTLGKEKWSFNAIKISGTISQRDDGIFTADFKTPPWLKIDSIDIQATPLEMPKPDNFGFLLGSTYGHSFKEGGEDYLKVTGGLRYKKVYVEVGAGTNSTVEGGLKYEF